MKNKKEEMVISLANILSEYDWSSTTAHREAEKLFEEAITRAKRDCCEKLFDKYILRLQHQKCPPHIIEEARKKKAEICLVAKKITEKKYSEKIPPYPYPFVECPREDSIPFVGPIITLSYLNYIQLMNMVSVNSKIDLDPKKIIDLDDAKRPESLYWLFNVNRQSAIWYDERIRKWYNVAFTAVEAINIYILTVGFAKGYEIPAFGSKYPSSYTPTIGSMFGKYRHPVLYWRVSGSIE